MDAIAAELRTLGTAATLRTHRSTGRRLTRGLAAPRPRCTCRCLCRYIGKKRPPATVRKPRDDERDPPPRLRHELRRSYLTRNVDASARSLDRVQHDRILAGFGTAGGTRQV